MKWPGSVSWYFLGATLVPRPNTRVGQARRHLRQARGSGHLSSITLIVGSIAQPSYHTLATAGRVARSTILMASGLHTLRQSPQPKHFIGSDRKSTRLHSRHT